MRGPHLVSLEGELKRIPGVKGVRVVGDESPTEIHVVASPDRTPKQIVRDVQSLAQAAYGLAIDHRIVSIVALEDEVAEVIAPEAPANGATNGAPNGSHRPALDRIVLASKGDSGWVKVALKWPDGDVTEGAEATGLSRDARAKGAVTALQRALEPVLAESRSRVEIEDVIIQKIGTGESVLVRAALYESGAQTPLVGSALISDDVASAAVRATLQALNRKLN